MLQDSRLQSIFEVLKVIPREFGIDPLVHELELDEGKKTLISLIYLQIYYCYYIPTSYSILCKSKNFLQIFFFANWITKDFTHIWKQKVPDVLAVKLKKSATTNVGIKWFTSKAKKKNQIFFSNAVPSKESEEWRKNRGKCTPNCTFLRILDHTTVDCPI